jgi:hypothetical protein
MNNPSNSSIPVLTEIIFPAVTESGDTDPTTNVLESTPEISDDTVKISDEQWQQLEQSMHENVLRQVLARVDFVLEHRVRDSLADVLQTAVATLAIEIQAGLRKTMEEVITRAITQEISKVRMSK